MKRIDWTAVTLFLGIVALVVVMYQAGVEDGRNQMLLNGYRKVAQGVR